MRKDLKHKAKLPHFTVEKPRRSQVVKTCAQGHTANQELWQEQKQGHQTLSLALFHLISLHPQADACRGGEDALQVRRK